jgi:hypothetical protein
VELKYCKFKGQKGKGKKGKGGAGGLSMRHGARHGYIRVWYTCDSGASTGSTTRVLPQKKVKKKTFDRQSKVGV